MFDNIGRLALNKYTTTNHVMISFWLKELQTKFTRLCARVDQRDELSKISENNAIVSVKKSRRSIRRLEEHS